ncbi:MAG: hypothetical protein HOV83_04290 [Catenulispora sp.]|nr:hypothetical protein [Catenulispora sp.]
MNPARQLGNALGIAVLGVLFHSGLSSSAQDAGIGGLTGRLASGQSGMVLAQTAPEHRAVLDHLVRQAFASGLRSALLGAAVAGVVGGLAVLLLVRRPAVPGGAAASQTSASAPQSIMVES